MRFPADHRRVTVPVNMDQKASSRIAANAQNLYRPRPKRTDWELSFLEWPVVVADDAENDVGVDIGSASSSFISPIVPKSDKFENKPKSENRIIFSELFDSSIHCRSSWM